MAKPETIQLAGLMALLMGFWGSSALLGQTTPKAPCRLAAAVQLEAATGAVFANGAPVVVTVRVKNVSAQDAYYLVADENYEIAVEDARGQETPRKRERGGSRHFNILPGGHQIEDKVDLGGIYSLESRVRTAYVYSAGSAPNPSQVDVKRPLPTCWRSL